MAHPLVNQLRFTRSEMMRALENIHEPDASVRLLPMNCISWMVGHLASQENAYFVLFGQNEKLHPELRDLVGTGKPASTPHLSEMLALWNEITAAADRFLDTVTEETLTKHLERNGRMLDESIGQLILRTIFHYWYHTGEMSAIRQMIGHTDLPQFVGDLPDWA